MLVLALLLLQGPVPQEPEFDTGPVPDWVDRATIAALTDVPVDEITGGIYGVLADTQDNCLGEAAQVFCDYAWYVHDTQGVQNGSQVSIGFDPSYQSLTIHALDVIREGDVSERLDPHRVRVVQREKDLDLQIYDGSKTAVVFVDDVRPGDVVRHAYTITGSHPAFRGHYARSISLAAPTPQRHIRHRLLWPAERPLTIRYHVERREPEIDESGGVRDYRWEARNVPAVVIDHPLPSWYYAVPWIQFTSFPSWNTVARLESELLARPEEVGPALAADIETLREGHSQQIERAEAAVRFVQDDVRYLGIELGVGAYRASPPDEVHARRFGDCKDKSLLLVTMLDQLGIEARLGLVSTHLKHTVDDYAPSPTLFDHVIVRIDLPGGPYWVDPTESLVGGGLDAYEPPDFGKALVVGESTTEPELVTSEGTPSLTTVRYRFVAADTDLPPRLDVVTEYLGRSANDFRTRYGWTTADQYTRDCLDYYRSWYESVRSLGPIEVADDRDANVVRTTLRYELPEFWTDRDGEGWAELCAMEIGGILPDLAAGPREHAVGIPHPLNYEQSLEIELPREPGDWFTSESEVVDNAGLRFTFDASAAGRTLRLDYTLRSKADFVPAAEAEGFVEDVNRAIELLYYDVPRGHATPPDDSPKATFPWLGGALLAGFLALGLFAGGVALRSIGLRRGRSFAEVVDDVAGSSPWLSMWTRPRATMRAILDSPRAQEVEGLAVAIGILSALDLAVKNSLGDELAPLPLTALVLVGGAFVGVLQLYLIGWLLGRVGRLLRGKASDGDVRAAFAWSSVILIGFSAVWIPRLLIFRGELFTTAMPRTGNSPGLMALLLGLGLVETLGALWSFVVFVVCLAEAHRFSIWRALLAALIPALVLFLVATVVVILFMTFF